MPIPPELRRKFYGHHWRTVIRPRILARAGDKCEQCRVPNYTDVARHGGMWIRTTVHWYFGLQDVLHNEYGEVLNEWPDVEWHGVRIVLGVAHLNHVSGEDDDENLRALCQWCHLNWDKLQHKETRCRRKDQSRPLLALAM